MKSPASRRFRTQNVEWQARLQGLPLASFGARALAFLVDSLIVFALLGAATRWSPIAGRWPGQAFELSFDARDVVSFAGFIAYFGLATFIGKGATPGKRLTGIRVVSLVHDRMSLWHCVERALGYAASSLEAGFGFLQYFTHPNGQTVHDRIAETIVIRVGPTKGSRVA